MAFAGDERGVGGQGGPPVRRGHVAIGTHTHTGADLHDFSLGRPAAGYVVGNPPPVDEWTTLVDHRAAACPDSASRVAPLPKRRTGDPPIDTLPRSFIPPQDHGPAVSGPRPHLPPADPGPAQSSPARWRATERQRGRPKTSQASRIRTASQHGPAPVTLRDHSTRSVPGPLLVNNHVPPHRHSDRILSLADEITSSGCAAAAIDGPFHGERVTSPLTPVECQGRITAEDISRVPLVAGSKG